MKTGVIKINEAFHSGYRIDPSLHLSDGAKVRSELAHLPYALTTVSGCSSSIFLGNIFSRCFVEKPEYGVTYLAASDTVLSNIETGRYLSKKQAAKLDYLMLDKDWILVTCSGTLGNVTYTNKTFCNKIATHDLIRIIPDDHKYKKGCLYAFLSGKYGYFQITQSQFGGVVKHINDKQAGAILVPVFPDDFQQKVDELIQESARLKEEATNSLNEAKSLIVDFCEIPFVKKEGLDAEIVSSSNIHNSLNVRFDAPVFMNDGVCWARQIKRETVLLGDCQIKTWYPGMFKRAYVENGYPYIKGSELFLANPFSRCEMLSRTKTPKLEQLWLKEGQLLISCAGACGLVKLITKEYEEKQAIGSPDIIRLTSEDPLFTKEYLFVYLQIPAIYDYMQSLKYGSVIERFDISNIETIPIVKPTEMLSRTVTEIIHHYADYTYRAFKAEEMAISMVEKEIEKWNN